VVVLVGVVVVVVVVVVVLTVTVAAVIAVMLCSLQAFLFAGHPIDVRCWLPSRPCIFRAPEEGGLFGFRNPTQLWVCRPV
jgi:hypothetical protein